MAISVATLDDYMLYFDYNHSKYPENFDPTTKIGSAKVFADEYLAFLDAKYFNNTLKDRVIQSIIFGKNAKWILTRWQQAVTWQSSLESGTKWARIYIHQRFADISSPESRDKLRDLIIHEAVHAFMYLADYKEEEEEHGPVWEAKAIEVARSEGVVLRFGDREIG